MKARLPLDGIVALDTSIFIYFIEGHPLYVDRIRPMFEAATEGKVKLVTSAMTLLEALVVPYRHADIATAERYESLLGGSRGLTTVPIERPILRAAAQLCAVTSLRSADAIQVASALAARCSTFVTNDKRVPAIKGLRIVQLGDLS